MENSIIGEVNFRFSNRFSQLIGRNLISNPIVAVSELVKNSYDADANNIQVTFSDLDSDNSILRISDDGEGMSYNDIESKWMIVGTDNKLHTPLTTKGRRKLGEKGIGRFSVERLARRLTINSTKEGDDFGITLSIDWDGYDQFKGDFSSVKHQVLQIPSDVEKHGTVLIMEGLRDHWSKETLLDLRKELELLRPIDINKVSHKKYDLAGSDVSISLIAPEITTNKQLIDSKFITFAQAHLFGEIKDDGTAEVKVHIKQNISANNSEISETYKYNLGEIDLSCGPLTYEAFVFLKDKRLYRSLSVSRKDVDDYLDAFCGVKIYRDGFRIMPFGDKENDWLELNAQRTSSPEYRISTQNTIGIVYITRDTNPGLQDVLSRENMYETPEFLSLKKFVSLAFSKYTELQLGARKKKDRIIKEDGKRALANAQKAVSSFSNQVGALKQTVSTLNNEQNASQKDSLLFSIESQVSEIASSAEDSLKVLKYAYSYYKKQTDFRSREMQIYRNIATLGISAAMFGHEALNHTVDAKAILNEVFANHAQILLGIADLEILLKDLQRDLFLIDEKADFFRSYLQRDKQERTRYINLYTSLNKLIAQHQNAFNAIGVVPIVQLLCEEKELFMWAYEGDVDTVFTNLITNAYKALKKANGEKYLRFSFDFQDGNIIINTYNNGQPIAQDNRNRIFEPMFSTYPDGTGLGLTIIQDTLLFYQGKINIEADYPETHFKVFVPRLSEPKEVK